MDDLGADAPEIRRALWCIEDARRRTLAALDGLSPEALDWAPPWAGNSIGTTLYHLAVIEADYLFVDILGHEELPPDVMAWFPFDVRDEPGLLSVVRGTPLTEHLERLATVCARLRATVSQLTLDDFRPPRSLPTYDATPAWVLHHLTQHEVEHRGQIGELRLAAEQGGAKG